MNPRLTLQWFDGRTAAARPVLAWLAQGRLHLADAAGEGGAELGSYAQADVVWPERQRHGQRQALLPDGSVLTGSDAAAWDAWRASAGHRDGAVVRAQQSWRGVLAALALLCAVLLGTWRWALPWAADHAAAWVPDSVQQTLTTATLAQLDQRWLTPSTLPQVQREHIAADFAASVARAWPQGSAPAWRLVWRHGGEDVGPNAFALPGGTIVITDELVTLLADAPHAIQGVLAHELGHLHHAHGLRLVARTGAAAALAGLIFGDATWLVSAAPVLLVQADYSRDFEREADAYALELLHGAGLDPRQMALFFDRIAARRSQEGTPELPIAIASHPSDAERRARFAAAAAR